MTTPAQIPEQRSGFDRRNGVDRRKGWPSGGKIVRWVNHLSDSQLVQLATMFDATRSDGNYNPKKLREAILFFIVRTPPTSA